MPRAAFPVRSTKPQRAAGSTSRRRFGRFAARRTGSKQPRGRAPVPVRLRPMSASATLTHDRALVDPGSEVRCPLVLRNNGTVVDQFTFEVLGAPAAWATVEPPSVSLFPGAEQTVEICFRPPRATRRRGRPDAVRVKVTPRERPTDTVVEEGTITVGALHRHVLRGHPPLGTRSHPGPLRARPRRQGQLPRQRPPERCGRQQLAAVHVQPAGAHVGSRRGRLRQGRRPPEADIPPRHATHAPVPRAERGRRRPAARGVGDVHPGSAHPQVVAEGPARTPRDRGRPRRAVVRAPAPEDPQRGPSGRAAAGPGPDRRPGCRRCRRRRDAVENRRAADDS